MSYGYTAFLSITLPETDFVGTSDWDGLNLQDMFSKGLLKIVSIVPFRVFSDRPVFESSVS